MEITALAILSQLYINHWGVRLEVIMSNCISCGRDLDVWRSNTEQRERIDVWPMRIENFYKNA